MTEIIRGFQLERATNVEVQNYRRLLNDQSVLHLNRGMGLAGLAKILKVNLVRREFGDLITDISIKLFMVGNKSNYYVGSKKGIGRGNIHRRVEDVDTKTFEDLHKKLIDVFVKQKKYKKSVEIFVRQNSPFIKELQRCDFKEVDNLADDDKVLVRDYYCALLHQVYDKRYHSKSALISTTTDEEVAKRFKGDEGVLIKYFIPQEKVSTLAITPYFFKDSRVVRLITEKQLPIISNPPYIEQTEYSVRRALFPHFISSFTYLNGEESRTVLNPEMNNFATGVLNDGFNINQERFFDVVRDTEFVRQGELVNGYRFREI